MPGASMRAMRKMVNAIKHWRIHRSTTDDLSDFSRRYNAVIRGWVEYYGKFWYRNFSYLLWRALQSRLLKWMICKYQI
ncbi:group II intron maturase-specific domain-containing protein [Pseudomonas sp. MDT1-17]